MDSVFYLRLIVFLCFCESIAFKFGFGSGIGMELVQKMDVSRFNDGS